MDIGNITLDQVVSAISIATIIIGFVSMIMNKINKTISEIKEPIETLDTKVDDVTKSIDKFKSEMSESIDDIRAATVASLRYSLMDTAKAYKKQGYATIEQKEQLMKDVDIYTKNGGNGFLPGIVNSCIKDLPDEPVKKTPKNRKNGGEIIND